MQNRTSADVPHDSTNFHATRCKEDVAHSLDSGESEMDIFVHIVYTFMNIYVASDHRARKLVWIFNTNLSFPSHPETHAYL